jgi:hypothetical protein
MTNPNKTSITVILDKSGSMDTIKSDTVDSSQDRADNA